MTRSAATSFQAIFGHDTGRTRLHLAGYLDEAAHLPSPADKQFRYPVEIDISGVLLVNSIGVRNWMKFIQPLSERGDVVLVRCPEVMVRQFSMIHGSLAKAKVRTLLAPYRCSVCGAPEDKELSMGVDVDPANPTAQPPIKPCGECNDKSLFDDVPEMYFSFTQVMAR